VLLTRPRPSRRIPTGTSRWAEGQTLPRPHEHVARRRRRPTDRVKGTPASESSGQAHTATARRPGSGRQVRNRARSRRNQGSGPNHDHHRNHRSGFCGFCGAWQESPMRDARLTMTEPGRVAPTAPSATCRLSRYPARTAPAVPRHVGSRAWRPTAAGGLPLGAAGAVPTAARPTVDPPERPWRR
jgi:hypothetical protein